METLDEHLDGIGQELGYNIPETIAECQGGILLWLKEMNKYKYKATGKLHWTYTNRIGIGLKAINYPRKGSQTTLF